MRFVLTILCGFTFFTNTYAEVLRFANRTPVSGDSRDIFCREPRFYVDAVFNDPETFQQLNFHFVMDETPNGPFNPQISNEQAELEILFRPIFTPTAFLRSSGDFMEINQCGVFGQTKGLFEQFQLTIENQDRAFIPNLSKFEALRYLAEGTEGEWISGSHRGVMTLACDVNEDTFCDGTDFDVLAKAIRDGNTDQIHDLDLNYRVGEKDRQFWVSDLMMTTPGDADLNRSFDSSDLVAVFVKGLYESRAEAGWEAGDWSGDGFFTSTDLVLAFVDGDYESDSASAVAVPEPTGVFVCLILLMSVAIAGRDARTVRDQH